MMESMSGSEVRRTAINGSQFVKWASMLTMVTEVRIAKPDGSDEEEEIASAQVGLTMISRPPEECRRPPWLSLRLKGITSGARKALTH